MSKPLIPIAISSQLDESGEERIHAAQTNEIIRVPYVIPPVPPLTVYAAVTNSMQLKSSTEGSPFVTAPSSSGILNQSSTVAVRRAGGALYHFSRGSGAVTADGTTWQAVTGIPSTAQAGAGYIARYDGEWLLSASGKLYESNDGMAFTERLSSFTGGLKERLNDMWLHATGNSVRYSTDNWATTNTYSLGTVFAFSGLLEYLAVPTFGFLLFGYNPSSQPIVVYSPTGLPATWTTISPPWTETWTAKAVHDPNTGRVWVSVTGSGSFTVKVYYAEAGSTTFNFFGSFPCGFPSGAVGNLEIAGDWLYKPAPQGSGRTTIYGSPVTESNWQRLYNVTDSNAIESICAWRPGYDE